MLDPCARGRNQRGIAQVGHINSTTDTSGSNNGFVARHRQVYGALGDLLSTDVHALAIDARAPDEQSR